MTVPESLLVALIAMALAIAIGAPKPARGEAPGLAAAVASE